MTEYSKYNIVYRLQKWIDSVPGQTDPPARSEHHAVRRYGN